ncbi:MAG: gamma-glutamyl-gamma-aminobutyrate hydrolase family protein [Firmicutes bacterium]|nr:gamma-glutamyl-gamma-aminobutyrate hydrolase family protein [Bacillota bacterium]MDD4336272.1 gamma-glutamyl-gamma-aminobutyrate hydrolase family protein [Bacillota bacterium]MDD4791956.1 gamma-glutamyl-gamma-aminobutyrate hydrolase family protein [Bacillota bacterium]
MTPVCLVSSDCESGASGKVAVAVDYVKAIYRSGGTPLVAAPAFGCADPARVAREMLSYARGLLLTGGDDIDPRLYGETHPHPKIAAINPVRDEFEMALAVAALELDIPILGICRGAQVLNVAAGGGLIQDIPGCVDGAHAHRISAPRWHPTHRVRLAHDSTLFRIFSKEVIWVNSFHHQAVGPVAPGFAVTAVADDGVVEAIERLDSRFVVGVQWHPEGLAERDPQSLSLFNEFVNAVRGV